jgi:hypothetical protein
MKNLTGQDWSDHLFANDAPYDITDKEFGPV